MQHVYLSIIISFLSQDFVLFHSHRPVKALDSGFVPIQGLQPSKCAPFFLEESFKVFHITSGRWVKKSLLSISSMWNFIFKRQLKCQLTSCAEKVNSVFSGWSRKLKWPITIRFRGGLVYVWWLCCTFACVSVQVCSCIIKSIYWPDQSAVHSAGKDTRMCPSVSPVTPPL